MYPSVGPQRDPVSPFADFQNLETPLLIVRSRSSYPTLLNPVTKSKRLRLMRSKLKEFDLDVNSERIGEKVFLEEQQECIISKSIKQLQESTAKFIYCCKLRMKFITFRSYATSREGEDHSQRVYADCPNPWIDKYHQNRPPHLHSVQM